MHGGKTMHGGKSMHGGKTMHGGKSSGKHLPHPRFGKTMSRKTSGKTMYLNNIEQVRRHQRSPRAAEQFEGVRRGEGLDMLSLLVSLRKCCNHPQLFGSSMSTRPSSNTSTL
jgi:SNF2 family DNA or RNA helicase